MLRSLWTMIRSSVRDRMAGVEAGAGRRDLELAARGRRGTRPRSAIRWCRPSAPSASSAVAARSRRGSRASAACATGRTDRGACRPPAAASRRSAARRSPRRAAPASAARAPRSRARRCGCFTRIALPCQPMLRVLSLSSRSVCLRALSNIRLWRTPRCTGLYRPWLSISSCGTVEPRPPMRLSASCSATMSASISCSTLSTRCGSRRPSSPTALCML